MLRDRFNRKMDYLRVSVTDKCNLRCVYCMPPAGVEYKPHDEVLRNEEFVHFIELFVSMGVRKVRFTGGEPLLRKGFVDMLEKTRSLFPDLEMALTTNGVLLGDYLEDFRRLGLRRLNLSLDSLNREHYRSLTGRDELPRLLDNLDRALALDCFDIKINAVLLKEALDDLDLLLDYFKDRKVVLRFIERMPFFADDKKTSFHSSEELVALLSRKGDLVRSHGIDTNVAVMYELLYRESYPMKIGVIPPITHKFCDRCNRLRLTCDGMLKTCLHSREECDLKTPYRMDAGDDILRSLIRKAVSEKVKEHRLECAFNENQDCCSLINSRSMSGIGG